VDIDNSATNYPQGVSFSPDGLCVLTTTVDDHRLRLYNTPPVLLQRDDEQEQEQHEQQSLNNNKNKPITPLTSVLSCPNGDVVRSYAWYPHMNSSNPATCCFAASCR
jgi:WD40 repeat protein